MHFDLKKLLSPKSVAIVGASSRRGVTAMRVAANLRAFGFGGPVRLVNPRYPEIEGEPCFPALSALPEVPDAVFVGVAAEHAVGIVEEAGRCGVRAAIVNASGFADSGAEGEALQDRLAQAAKSSGMAVCGPNNMGYINVHDRVCMYTARALPRLDPGPAAIISQSGSVAIAISQDARRLGISHVITAGNEAVCTAADYLRAVVEDDRVRVVMMFLETIRDRQCFAEGAAEAAGATSRSSSSRSAVAKAREPPSPPIPALSLARTESTTRFSTATGLCAPATSMR